MTVLSKTKGAAEAALSGVSQPASENHAVMYLPLPSSHDLVGVLGPVVLTQALLMASSEPKLAPGGAIGREPVRHEHTR
jgi:hypothetical protein